MKHFYKRKGDGRYYVQWKSSDGKWRNRSLGKNEQVAKAKYKELRFKDLDSIFLDTNKKNGTLFSSIAEDYLSYSKANKSPRTVEDDQRAIKLWLQVIGDKHIDTIRITDIMEFANYRKTVDNVNKATLRINLSCLRAMFNWARRMEKTTNYPFKHYKMEIGERRLDYLSKEELNKLIDISPEPWKTFFIILAITGWRTGEFVNLEWDNVMEDKIILNGKTGRRLFPIIDKVGLKILPFKLTHLLEQLKVKSETGYIFELNGRHPTYSWLKDNFSIYAKQINLKYSLYTLRHTFATRLILAGVNIVAVSKLMGHTSLQTTQIYEHLAVNNIENLL